MPDINYNLQFDKLCNSLQLGSLLSEPEPITGGYLHRMYAVKTERGKYAVKALNPSIMQRPTAIKNTLNSDLISNIAGNFVPALPAISVGYNSIINIENQLYMAYEWVDGSTLKANEIKPFHCEIMGRILAKLHRINYSALNLEQDQESQRKPINWSYYLQAGKAMNAAWVHPFSDHLDHLITWNEKADQADKVLSNNKVISHRDLDPKNVMWDNDKPVIIDWESAGYINPLQDFTETAIYWSEDETGMIDKEKFDAFTLGYWQNSGSQEADWSMVLDNGFIGKLEWLEYSLKRSLRIECTDEQEQQMGSQQVTATLEALIRYNNMIADIVTWLST